MAGVSSRCSAAAPAARCSPANRTIDRARHHLDRLGRRRLEPLTWPAAWRAIAGPEVLLIGSWHPLALQARLAGCITARLADSGRPTTLVLGMVADSTLRRGRRPRDLPPHLLAAVDEGLGDQRSRVEVRGGASNGDDPWNYDRLLPLVADARRRGRRVVVYTGELHLAPHLLPAALTSALPREPFQVLWPGAPAPFRRLARRRDGQTPARLSAREIYLPLCHPLHREASLRGWQEDQPLLPPRRLCPWLPAGPELRSAARGLAREVAELLDRPLPARLRLLTFADPDLADRLAALPGAALRRRARAALDAGEGLALPGALTVILGGSEQVAAAEEFAHLLHIRHAGIETDRPMSPARALATITLAEAVARAAARLTVTGAPPWRPDLSGLSPACAAWYRTARRRLGGRGQLPPPATDLEVREISQAGHLLGYALADRIVAGPAPRARLRRLARPLPDGSTSSLESRLREVVT